MKRTGFAAAALYALTISPAEAQDAAAGLKAFNAKCKTCHTVDKGGKNLVGPNLHGVFGAKAAGKEGFAYSDAMKNSGIVWDEQTVREYVADPKKRVPENKMAFVGIKRESELSDIVAYLKAATSK